MPIEHNAIVYDPVPHRLDFTNDMHVLATLRDPNVTKMIALVEEEPFGAVFEYGQHGDLPTFLESREKSGNEEDTFR